MNTLCQIQLLVLIAFMVFLSNCSDSGSVQVDVDLAVNASGNPITELDQDFDDERSWGIFFFIERANNCPPINEFDFDSASPVLELPETVPGFRPASDSFNLDTSSLNPNWYYRIRMVALPRDAPSNPSHEGFSDCPFSPALGGENTVNICFGNVAQTASNPLCPDSLPFSACPSILESARVCP